MTNPDIERAARGLYRAMNGKDCDALYLSTPCTGGQSYLDGVRAVIAVIAAIRDPSEKIIEAGHKELLSCDESPTLEDAADIFRAMIDKMLED